MYCGTAQQVVLIVVTVLMCAVLYRSDSASHVTHLSWARCALSRHRLQDRKKKPSRLIVRLKSQPGLWKAVCRRRRRQVLWTVIVFLSRKTRAGACQVARRITCQGKHGWAHARSREGFSCVAEIFVGNNVEVGTVCDIMFECCTVAGIGSCVEDVVKSLARMR